MADKTWITTYDCDNNNSGKWFMNRNHLAKEYAISNFKDNNMVVTMYSDDRTNSPGDDGVPWASSTVDDSVHKPKNVIEKNDECWMSAPGEKEVEFKLTLPWYTTVN